MAPAAGGVVRSGVEESSKPRFLVIVGSGATVESIALEFAVVPECEIIADRRVTDRRRITIDCSGRERRWRERRSNGLNESRRALHVYS